jgi:hypothetical protein
MNRFMQRAVALGTVTVIGLALGGINPARADPPPFSENWQNCPAGGHVAYNPITGESMQVSHTESISEPPSRPFYTWVCVETGGTAGSHSVGAAGYLTGGMVPLYVQHTLACPGVFGMGCTGTWTGASMQSPNAGALGAQPCVSPVVPELATCQSVGVTPNVSSGVGVDFPEQPRDREICGVKFEGTCAVPRTAVHTGGSVATVYVGTSPTDVNVPVTCTGVNRPNLAVVSPQVGSSSC